MLVNSAVSPSQTFTETNIKYLVLITFLNYITYLLITLISPYCFFGNFAENSFQCRQF